MWVPQTHFGGSNAAEVAIRHVQKPLKGADQSSPSRQVWASQRGFQAPDLGGAAPSGGGGGGGAKGPPPTLSIVAKQNGGFPDAGARDAPPAADDHPQVKGCRAACGSQRTGPQYSSSGR